MSQTSTSKPIGSLIKTQLAIRRSPIQSAPGAPGLPARRSSPGATAKPVELPKADPVEVPELVIERLLRGSEEDCARVKKWWLTPFLDRQAMASDDLELLRRNCNDAMLELDHRLRPADEPDVAELLLAFVEMLNVMEPGERGIMLYMAALEPVPRLLYPTMAINVARTHRYRSLPTPADFISSVAGELTWIRTQRNLLTGVIDFVNRTLNQRAHQRRMFP